MPVSRRRAINRVVLFLAAALRTRPRSLAEMSVAVPLAVAMRVLCGHIRGPERPGKFPGSEDPVPLGPEAGAEVFEGVVPDSSPLPPGAERFALPDPDAPDPGPRP